MVHIAIAAAGMGMSFVIGYAFWSKIRALWLRADLLEIATDLRTDAIAFGRTDDPVYKKTFSNLRTLAACKSDIISLPSLVYVLVMFRQAKPPAMLKSENPEMQASIDRCNKRLGDRFARYVAFETLGGLLAVLLVFGALLIAIPSRILRKEISQVVGKFFEAFWTISHGSTC